MTTDPIVRAADEALRRGLWVRGVSLTIRDQETLAGVIVAAVTPLIRADQEQKTRAPFEGLADLWAGRETTATEYAMYQELQQALADSRQIARGEQHD